MPDLLTRLKSPQHMRQQLGGIFFLFLIVFGKTGASDFSALYLLPVAALLFLVGVAGRVWSSGFLVKNDRLTTTGPYGFVRNPIYVSNLLCGAGLILLSGRYWAFAILALLYFVCYVPGMKTEEENLRRRYGSDFETFASSVPLIRPRLSRAIGYGGDAWSWRAYVANREQYVTIGLVLGLAEVLRRRFFG